MLLAGKLCGIAKHHGSIHVSIVFIGLQSDSIMFCHLITGREPLLGYRNQDPAICSGNVTKPIINMALEPTVGPWALFRFLDPIQSL
jgi:hypothetical protein